MGDIFITKCQSCGHVGFGFFVFWVFFATFNDKNVSKCYRFQTKRSPGHEEFSLESAKVIKEMRGQGSSILIQKGETHFLPV